MSETVRRNEIRDDETEIDLLVLIRNMWEGFIKFWWIIFIGMVCLASLVVIVKAKTYKPMYESTASFTVATSNSVVEDIDSTYSFNYNRSTASQMSLTFPYILQSDVLMEMVRDDLGVEEINGTVSADAVSSSNLFEMTVVSDNPKDAQDILKAVLENFPKVSRYVIGETKFYMIEEPTISAEPYNKLSIVKEAAKGALIGLFLGFAAVFIYAFTRHTITKEEEIKETLNQKCLGSLPMVKFKKRNRRFDHSVTINNSLVPASFSEPLRSIAVRIERRMKQRDEKILMIASTIPHEGKSTIAMNLAYALTHRGNKVILVDLDLRKQDLAQTMKVDGCVFSIADIAEGRATIQEALVKVNDLELYLIGGRTAINDPVRVLSSQSFKDVMKKLKDYADFVVIDTPPCVMMTDAAEIGECTDLAVYVIKQDFAKTGQILDGIQGLAARGVEIMGCIINSASMKAAHLGYGYGYGKYGTYGYGRYGKPKASGNLKQDS